MTEERKRLCRRVGKLLALTRSSHKPEAESALTAAITLIKDNSLTQAEVLAHCDKITVGWLRLVSRSI